MALIDKTEREKAALIYGGQQGGEYMESIGVYDMRQMTKEQWATFVEAIVAGNADYLIEHAETQRP